MRARAAALGVVLLAAVATAASGGRPASSASAAPLRHAGEHLQYVQAMVDAAQPGSVVVVPAGTYEGLVVIDKPLILRGEGRPVLDGAGAGSVVTIASPDVTVEGFVVRGSAPGPIDEPSGVLIRPGADRARVTKVVVRDSYLGVTVQRASGVLLERLDILGSGVVAGELHAVSADGETTHDQHGAGSSTASSRLRGDGIWLFDTVDAVVRDSRIEHVRDGVYLSYGSGAVIDGNVIADSRYAVHDMYAGDVTIRGNRLRGNLSGLVLMYGGPVLVEANTITESGSPSTGFGVLVKDAAGVLLRGNVIADNRVGMHLDDAGRTGADPSRVEGNTIAMNQIGALVFPSADSVFTGNGFVENSTQVTLGGAGTTQVRWSEAGVGNYWSDYGGYDADGDGVGDLAYRQSGRISRLLAEEPQLLALASGPAFRLLGAVEDRWVPADPVVADSEPLVSMGSPAVRVAREGPPVPLWVPGLLALALSGWILLRGRRPSGGRHG